MNNFIKMNLINITMKKILSLLILFGTPNRDVMISELISQIISGKFYLHMPCCDWLVGFYCIKDDLSK